MMYKIDNLKVKIILTKEQPLRDSPVWYAYVQSIPVYTFTSGARLVALVGTRKRAAGAASEAA